MYRALLFQQYTLGRRHTRLFAVLVAVLVCFGAIARVRRHNLLVQCHLRARAQEPLLELRALQRNECAVRSTASSAFGSVWKLVDARGFLWKLADSCQCL
eukprot:6210999-Pleurochrysis_carterae.AAC.2